MGGDRASQWLKHVHWFTLNHSPRLQSPIQPGAGAPFTTGQPLCATTSPNASMCIMRLKRFPLSVGRIIQGYKYYRGYKYYSTSTVHTPRLTFHHLPCSPSKSVLTCFKHIALAMFAQCVSRRNPGEAALPSLAAAETFTNKVPMAKFPAACRCATT